jgi:hypothetical protein
MQCGINDLWCLYFRYEKNRAERLLLMKPIIEEEKGLILLIYNNQAKLLNLPLLNEN